MVKQKKLPIRVALFDDNAERRASLQYLIQMQKELTFAGAFADGLHAARDVKKSEAAVVLMDIAMPGINGIEAVKHIKKEQPECVILMQTVLDDDELIFKAIEAGASGYLLKNTAPQRVVQSILDAAEGGAPMTPSIAMKVLSYFREKSQQHKNYDLSQRETEILELLVKGHSYKMAAAALNLSYHTINSHVRHIYEKLHVHSLGEAVAKAIKENIV